MNCFDFDLEPECTCERLDVDCYDASGCELCNPLSAWNRMRRELEREHAEPMLCPVPYEIHCHHCGSTADSVDSDGLFLAIEGPVCCETVIPEAAVRRVA